jgi:hypothetical protein
VSHFYNTLPTIRNSFVHHFYQNHKHLNFNRMKKLFTFTQMLFCCSTLMMSQHLIRVNNSANYDADYTSLQSAVTNALAGDTIYVEGSATEYAGATITKKLTIIGPGYFLSENPQTQANGLAATFNSNITFTTGSDGSTIMGCSIPSYNLVINVSNMTVKRNYLYSVEFTKAVENIAVVQNDIGGSIYTTSPGSIKNSMINNNIIMSYIQTGSINCYNATIQNNIFAGANSYITENTGNTISYNLFGKDGINENGNQYNIVMSLVFNDIDGTKGFSDDARWMLCESSLATGAGMGGTDCGISGGTMPYVLSGLPTIPHIYAAEVPASATSSGGLKVTIKVKASE